MTNQITPVPTHRPRLRRRVAGLAAALAITGVGLGALPSAANAEQAATTHTNREWARLVLTDGGWPTSANNTTVLLQWMASEEPVSNWYNRDNPLNNSLGTSSTDGTSSYPNLRTAASYVVKTLALSYYKDIRADLNASAAPATTAHDIQESPWSESHYGHGSAWRTSAVATTACPSSRW